MARILRHIHLLSGTTLILYNLLKNSKNNSISFENGFGQDSSFVDTVASYKE